MMKIAPAVARAAEDSGVASRPIKDLDGYRDKLQSFVCASGTTMKPVFALAKTAARNRVAYREGEEERVLRAAQIVVDEGVARPTFIGRPSVIAERILKFGLRLQKGRDYDIVNTGHDDRYRDFWQTYHRMTERNGVTAQMAKAGGNIAIGPVLLGAAKPLHILTASATVRRIVNMTALAVADANAAR